MPWLTSIIRRPIRDPEGRVVGRVHDLLANREKFPRVSGVSIKLSRAGRELLGDRPSTTLPWTSFSFKEPLLTLAQMSEEAPSGDLLLRDQILDRQIVDTDGARVVRVNDVLLSESAGGLRVVAADVGVKGVFRQIGIEGIANKLSDALGYEISEKLIAWNYVQALEEGPSEVRLNVPTKMLRELHPSELADILDQLDGDRRERIIRMMTITYLAETLAETEPEVSREALDVLGEERAKRILDVMPPDEAVDLLHAIGYDKSERLLSLMGVKRASVLRELLGYPPDTAGGRMTPSFVSVPEGATVQGAIDHIRAVASEAETINYAYVTEESGVLKGVLSLRDLLRSSPERAVREVMENDVVTVGLIEDQERVARDMSRYNLLAVPVIDEEGRIKGIVTVDDVVDVFREEASEDLSEVTGIYLGQVGATSGRFAGFGMALIGGAGAAALLQAQRPILASIAALVWLMPLYLRMAQDLGTWSLARALVARSLGHGARLEALSQDLLGALITSLSLGLVVGVFGVVWTKSQDAAVLLGVGIFVGTLAASLIGLALPTVVQALRLTRVLGRGRPLAIVVGLASLIVYAWAIGSLSVR